MNGHTRRALSKPIGLRVEWKVPGDGGFRDEGRDFVGNESEADELAQSLKKSGFETRLIHRRVGLPAKITYYQKPPHQIAWDIFVLPERYTYAFYVTTATDRESADQLVKEHTERHPKAVYYYIPKPVDSEGNRIHKDPRIGFKNMSSAMPDSDS